MINSPRVCIQVQSVYIEAQSSPDNERYVFAYTDKLTYAGNRESLADVSDSERYVFEHADICDAPAMARITC